MKKFIDEKNVLKSSFCQIDKNFWKKANEKVIDLPGEEWRPIKGWEMYEVSNMGRVKRTLQERFYLNGKSCLLSEKLMNQYYTWDGYAQVTLKQFGRRGTLYVHRLVLIAFDILPPTPEHTQANHKDQNPKNNRLDNLEWVTPLQNNEYGDRYERISKSMKKHYMKLSQKERNIALNPAHEARKRKVICDNKIYNSIKEFTHENELVYSAVINWLRGNKPMPQNWIDRGLAYEFSAEIADIFRMEEMRAACSDICLGNSLYIADGDNWIMPVLLQVNVDYDKTNGTTMTFSTDYKRKPLEYRFAKLFATIQQTSVKTSKFTFD